MPGLNQLKQFNSDLLNLGDEVKIRSARGEKPSIVPIPRDVQDIDDSEDFKFGMPQLSEEEQAQADAAAAEAAREQNDFSDITGEGDDEDDVPVAVDAAPDLTDLLAPDDGLSLDDLDLSEFEEPAKPKEPPKPKEIPIEDLDLSALLAPKPEPPKPEPVPEPPKPAARPAPKTARVPEPVQKPIPEPVSEPEMDLGADVLDFDTDIPDLTSAPDGDFSMPDFGSDVSMETPSVTEDNSGDILNDIPDFDSDFTEDTGAFDIDQENKEFEAAAKASAAVDMNSDIPMEFAEIPGTLQLAPDFEEDFEEEDTADSIPQDQDQNQDQNSSDSASLDTPDFGFGDFDLPEQDADNSTDGVNDGVDDGVDSGNEDSSAEEGSDASFDFDTSALDGMEDMSFDAADSDSSSLDSSDIPDTQASEATESMDSFDAPSSDDFNFDTTGLDGENPSMDFSSDSDAAGNDSFDSSETMDDSGNSASGLDGLGDLSDFGSLPDFGDGGQSVSPEMEVPDFGDQGETFEKFDTSAMEGMDFSSDSFDGSDFEMGNITSQEADEDDLFSIPGFSDTQTADLNKNRVDVQIPDFSEALEGNDKPKNTFTDTEYKRFQKNLAEYPLNVRIAIEDLVVKNEFTDDAVFAILEKVFRKVPARQIATELEKMLDVTLDVPRDFERRTASEYEAYKKSLEYQLKNRIIPGAIITTGAAILVSCLFLIIHTFIYKPAMASSLYKQGYVLLEENQYVQSLEKFNQAKDFKVEKEWFYKYAQSFRQHKQYDRSTSMYKAILAYFNHEKRAGLEWADMEMSDLCNYEETERILKREVLDYHVNDPDAILMLGDLYLDWATERNPDMFALAKEQYDLVSQVGYSSDTNKYLSRQMRYYIRTDNLRQVLAFKEYFFPIKKKGLGAQDLTELSGYLLDKLYGNLKPAEESLRFSIENVRELLERAIEADPENPVALYNMGRYFVETNNNSAVSYLNAAVGRFNNQTRRTKSDTYKFINTYRLLGEEYRDRREYILAEENYGEGIALYEKENYESGFASDANVGKLYADLGDLDYFISGDMDTALLNYERSIENYNDTAPVRYKIGYIQYTRQDYAKAMGSFMRSLEMADNDTHLLLALANTLSLRNDYYPAQGYYTNLVNILNGERELHEVILPQVRADQADLVDVYMRATNNLGVTQARLAENTGNSSLNAKALVNFQNSLRAWDALTRNTDTMVRLEGSNLAEQNVKYLTNPTSEYTPEIYTDIFKLMNGEVGLE